MNTNQTRLLPFLLFVLSGFCGLLYQVVWLRLAFAQFGVITPVLSVVLSVFMAGLAIGSWAGGKWIASWTSRTGKSAIFFYGLAEIVIGISSVAVPQLFFLGESALLPFGEMNSNSFLGLSAIILGITLLPWCFCMGTTFPFMMAYIQEKDPDSSKSFSLLYLGNVIGAMSGAILSACVFIELLGFQRTLLIAGSLNLLIAIVAFCMSRGYKVEKNTVSQHEQTPSPQKQKNPILGFILFMTGFISMAMEVVWTRAFTPVLQTTIYAFAALLATYLGATWIGSFFYRKHLAAQRVISLNGLLVALAVTSLLPPLLNDPRITSIQWIQVIITLLSIVPFCGILGYLTPQIIDDYARGKPQAAGHAYAINVIGCILGPLVAGYLILPFLGVRIALIVLALPCLVAIWIMRRMAGSVIFIALAIFIATKSKCYEDGLFYRNAEIRRDHVATVIAYGDGMSKGLLVNGVGMTYLTPILKVMAHVPLAIHTNKPDSALVICFGMGVTFRSMSSWDIETTAVELVPSVRDSFPYFFSDAQDVFAKPSNRVIIDDGRRFLRRTTNTYDMIAIDPPPPAEAAGVSLLYSRDFYETLKQRLKPNGILQQWSMGGEGATVVAVARSLTEAFPYVRVFHSIEDWGYHFLCSQEPIVIPNAAAFAERLPPKAQADFIEWRDDKNAQAFYQEVIDREVPIEQILSLKENVRITDDRPYNEYFLLRRLWNKAHGTHFSLH